MILSIIQTKTNFDMQWEILDKTNEYIATAISPFTQGKYEILLTYKDKRQEEQILYFNPTDTTWGNKMVERMSFKILKNNEKIGHIVGQVQKTGFLKGYPYYEIVYEGNLYYGYEVGFGKKGLYLCIYKGESLIAIVDKQLKVINYQDVYNIYFEDSMYIPVLLPFILYYDSTAYGDMMEVSLISIKTKQVITRQKELIAKYDPTFIPRIQKMDDII